MTKTTRKSVGKRTGIGPAQGYAVLADLVALKAMTVPELREKWAAIFDAPAPNTSRQNLELTMAWVWSPSGSSMCPTAIRLPSG